MQQIPSWIIEVVEKENLTCNRCKGKFKAENLMSIGIQESSRQPHTDTLCIGMYCPKCKDLTIFELREMSLIEFAFDIMDKDTDGDNNKKNSKKSRPAILSKPSGPFKRTRSKITTKDVQESVKFLQSHNHEEFLAALGMSPAEISKYSYSKSKSKPEKDNG